MAMTQDRSVTVAFEEVPVQPDTFTLAVMKSGQGTVNSSPAGISISAGGTSDSGQFEQGTTVTLTASASSGWRVASWGGACSGSGSTCQVIMTQDRSVTVEFEEIPAEPEAPTITTTSLPGGTVGESYSATLEATGGATPYTWSVASGSLPGGLSLSSAGVISGTPTTAGTSTVGFRVTGGDGLSRARTLSLVVSEAETDTSGPATVSIVQVLQGGQVADLNNASGRLDVVVNVRRNDETVQAVELILGEDQVVRQTVSGSQSEQTITLSFQTDLYGIVNGAAVIPIVNGSYQLRAQAVALADGVQVIRPSDELPLTVRNEDGFHIVSTWQGGEAMSSSGQVWIGGPEFQIQVNPIPVMYSGRTIGSMTVNLAQLNAQSPVSTERCSEAGETQAGGPFEFQCGGVEADAIVPRLTSTVASGGSGPSIRVDGSGILNLGAQGVDHPFPARIDVRPPLFSSAVFGIAQDPQILNTGNWANSEYRFSVGFRTGEVEDGGVGRPGSVWDEVEFAVSTGTTLSTVVWTGSYSSRLGDAGLPETETNTELYAWAIVSDRLGNSAFIRQQEGVDPLHPLGSFGYDRTPPTIAFATGNNANGAIRSTYTFINQFSSQDGIALTGSDGRSGFHSDFGAEHGLLGLRGLLNGDGGIETTSVIGGWSMSQSPFVAARFGDRMMDLAPITTPVASFPTTTQVDVDFTFQQALGSAAPARYYLYQVQLRDRAGNLSRGYRAVYLNNNSQPVVQGLQNPSGFNSDATFTAGLVQDSVEVVEGSLEIEYPNIGPDGGTIVWERPTSEVTSLLRMNAEIFDGMLFGDVIYRPQRNVRFPTALWALGVDFLRNVQTLQPGSIASAKPTAARVRVFSGWGVEEGDGSTELNHTSDIPSTGGVSVPAESLIQSSAISEPGFFFQSLSASPSSEPVGWSFSIVGGSAANCQAQYCVRATGPSSDFSNPFAGGAMLLAWADSGTPQRQWRILGFATPNFGGGNPTRTEGGHDVYEWSFDAGSISTGPMRGQLVIGAFGVRAGGDALFTEF